MKLPVITTLIIGLAILVQPAFAFQEGHIGAVPDGVVVNGEAGSKAAAEFGATTGLKPESAGTEVRIPGLGSLGVLPKLDFGLELLYGAASSAELVEQDADDKLLSTDDGNFRVRGTLKHRF